MTNVQISLRKLGLQSVCSPRRKKWTENFTLGFACGHIWAFIFYLKEMYSYFLDNVKTQTVNPELWRKFATTSKNWARRVLFFSPSQPIRVTLNVQRTRLTGDCRWWGGGIGCKLHPSESQASPNVSPRGQGTLSRTFALLTRLSTFDIPKKYEIFPLRFIFTKFCKFFCYAYISDMTHRDRVALPRCLK